MNFFPKSTPIVEGKKKNEIPAFPLPPTKLSPSIFKQLLNT
jgi:hypothetical protein